MSKTQRTAVALFLVALLIYLFPLIFDLAYKPFFGYIAGQDVVSTSFLPLSLYQRGDFTLREFTEFFEANWRSPYFVTELNGNAVSRYPVAAAVLAMPIYGLPIGLGWIANPPPGWLFYPWSAFFAAKFAAALMTALAVVMFFFCARELTDTRASLALAIAFGFGTSIWSTVSQGLWQHTPGVLLQVIALWFLLRGRRRGAKAVAPAAFFFSAATISRTYVAIAAALFTLYVLLVYRSALTRWVLWAIPPAILAFAYNAVYNGSPLVFGYQEGITQGMSLPRADALLGLLVSPSRGLLAYSPFLILAPIGLTVLRRESQRLFYFFAAATFVLCYLFLSLFQGWEGGWGYGTRLLTDVLPYAVLLLVPALKGMSGVSRRAFAVMVGYAVLVQSFGLWDFGARWHWHWPGWEANVWDVADSEPFFYFRQYTAMAGRFFSVLFRR